MILAGLERGLSMSDIKRMQVGQLADFCEEYNEREKKARKEQEKQAKGQGKRKATQADIKAFFG